MLGVLQSMVGVERSCLLLIISVGPCMHIGRFKMDMNLFFIRDHTVSEKDFCWSFMAWVIFQVCHVGLMEIRSKV